MKKCVIFCAGGFENLAEPVLPGDYVIAADGGLAHAQALSLTPDLILGDFDSLGYTPDRASVFPVEKDDTDSMLAIKQGLAAGCTDFVLYGAMDGNRPDHTLANYQALQYLADRGARGRLVGLRYEATVIRNGSLCLPARESGIVSVFCLGRDARGVDIGGLQYGLTDGTLSAGFPLGISNHFIGKEGRISVRDGSLLILWQR